MKASTAATSAVSNGLSARCLARQSTPTWLGALGGQCVEPLRQSRKRRDRLLSLRLFGLELVGVRPSARLWPPGSGPLPPKAWSGQGRPPTLMRRDAQNQPQSAEQLAKSLPADAGVTSHGAKASTKPCIPGSPSCACGPRIGTTGARNPIPKNGCSPNGRRAKARRANIGFRPCRPMPTSQPSLQLPKCAGGSSATIRNSSRNSASITMKEEAGEASTTTWGSASRPTDSWSPNEV